MLFRVRKVRKGAQLFHIGYHAIVDNFLHVLIHTLLFVFFLYIVVHLVHPSMYIIDI